jgi:hypothetical protein
MTTSQLILTCTIIVIGVAGGVLGVGAFVNAWRSICRGSVTLEGVASDDDLRPHPRYRRH